MAGKNNINVKRGIDKAIMPPLDSLKIIFYETLSKTNFLFDADV